MSIAGLMAPVVVQGANSAEYVVRSGDSLSGIAARHHVSLAAVLAANNLRITSVIFPGQHLTIPGASTGSSAATTSGSYTVKSGDSLSTIAARHHVSLAAVLAANNLRITSVIHPGQRLTIPGGSSSGSAPTTSGNYTVRSGDSLSGIAARHHVSLAAVLAANNLRITSVIFPGQRLTIPGGSSSGPAAAPSAANYTVKSGDSLGVIAARHNVPLAAVLSANNLTVNSVIHPGQRLVIPGGTPSAPARSSSSTAADRVVAYALAQVGKPYKFFTRGPYTFDCSGLTLAAYRQVGVTLVHHSASQARQGRPVNFYSEPIRAGDLVFTSTNGRPAINHVGIAISSTRWVQARRPGVPVQITPLPRDSAILAVRRFVTAS